MSWMAVRNIELNTRNRECRKALRDTLSVYRAACSCISRIVEERWPEISEYPDSKAQLTFVEGLIHSTKDNAALYPEFDRDFYKFPGYYRRSAANYVIGQVKAYHTSLEKYLAKRYEHISNGKRFREKPPVLNLNPNACPSMYKKEMYRMNGKSVFLKVFIRNTWDWIGVSCPNRDLKDLRNRDGVLKSPELSYKYHKYYLTFPVEYRGEAFPDIPLTEQVILSADLGVNQGAVASLMDASGTILGRFFDPFQSERDLMDHLINRIRKLQKSTGRNSLAAIYTKLDGVKTDYVRKLAHWLAELAEKYHVYGVVLEHLGKRKGRNKTARIHHWCKCRIRDLTRGMCLRKGIRTFLINPKDTSALAYDGSGKVERDRDNYSMCTFASGKRYHCDLSASYNIGARYFLRALSKTMPEKEWSQLTAEVPGLAKRTGWTLHTLWEVQKKQSSH